jgi:hypothetical protein
LIGRRAVYEPGSGQHKLWLNVGGSAGHSGTWGIDIDEGIDDDSGNGWDVTVMSESQARDSAAKSKKMRRNKAQEQRNIEKLHQDRQSVLSAVEAHPDGETRTVLRKKAGLNNERFNEALELLLEEGAVVDGGEITKANRRKYPSFKLNGTQKNDDE